MAPRGKPCPLRQRLLREARRYAVALEQRPEARPLAVPRSSVSIARANPGSLVAAHAPEPPALAAMIARAAWSSLARNCTRQLYELYLAAARALAQTPGGRRCR